MSLLAQNSISHFNPAGKTVFLQMKPEEKSFSIGRPGTVVITLAAIFLLVVLLLVFILKDSGLDEEVFSGLSGHITPARTRFFKDISFLGNHRFLIPANLLLIAYLIIKKNYWWAIGVTVVALSSLGIMSLLKNLIGLHRPSMPLVDGITNYGFPSGHSFMSVAFYGFLIVIAEKFIGNKTQRWVIVSFLTLLILLIGFSRIYLRVHYTTDVIAGWSAGILWFAISLFFLERIKTRRA